MTKRFGNFHVSNSKKQKTEENLDDLWGEDFNAEDVDDCFMLASQVLEQPDNIPYTQRNNVSILPLYSAFKQTSKRTFTSTQSDPELDSSLYFPSTSKGPTTNGVLSTKKDVFQRTRSFESAEQSSRLEMTMQNMQERFVAKEGEVSILRMQLKEIRTHNESEQTKKYKEWNDKFSATTKQLNAVKSELEFKNLEIANLKQKVVEVAKLNNLDASFSSTQSPYFKQPKVPERSMPTTTETATSSGSCKNVEIKLQPISETNYPLQNTILSSIFTLPKKERYLIDFKSKRVCRNTIPFLQNQTSQDVADRLIQLQPKSTVMEDNRILNFYYIYSDVSELIKCDLYGIESEENCAHINKVLCVSEQLLQNLYQFLQGLERSAQVEKCGKISAMYLKHKFENLHLDQSVFDAKQWCENEMGVAVRQSISCISEVLPYNSYLRGYLLENKPLLFKKDETYLKYLPSIQPKLEKGYINNSDLLSLILSVVRIIRRLKKSSSFPGLLSAVAILLNRICSCYNIDSTNNVIYDITRELVFCSPNIQVLSHIVEYFKNASLQKLFVDNLCKIPSKSILQLKQKERVLYYNQDTTCVLQVLCVLLEDYITKMQIKNILRLCSDITKFMFNVTECNPRWLFYQEDNCDCLSKIVKLFVDIIHRSIRGFQALVENNSADDLTEYHEILRCGLKVLHILNFRVYDLIVKYIATYSQYKVIINSLPNLQSQLNLTEYEVGIYQSLSIVEDTQVEKKSFRNIQLWQ